MEPASTPIAEPRYLSRALTWLGFNGRVLEEAQDSTNPALERARFLGIFASNLDEFFMIRVAGLRDAVRAGVEEGGRGAEPADATRDTASSTIV